MKLVCPALLKSKAATDGEEFAGSQNNVGAAVGGTPTFAITGFMTEQPGAVSDFI